MNIKSDADLNIPHQSYASLFLRFLRFGFLAWGGPVAQIAMIRQELVEEEKWISPEKFNRVLSVYQALPGPEAHELCVYFGMIARGRIGALLAGLGFMLPGFLLMLLLSWFYVTYGISSPLFQSVFMGMQPAVALGDKLNDPNSRLPGLPQYRWFYELLRANLAEDVRGRYPSAQQFKAELERQGSGPSTFL